MKKRDSIMLIVVLLFCTFFVIIDINFSSIFNSTKISDTNFKSSDTKTNVCQKTITQQVAQITCDRAHQQFDICSIKGPTVLEPTTSTFFLMGQNNSVHKITVEKIRPYPRKNWHGVMGRIKELTLRSGSPSPSCQIQHKLPALVFSAGGYTGNLFHDFGDILVPLFITVNTFFSHQDFILVISNSRDSWVHKYSELLQSLTKNPIVNLDKDTFTHCFPAAKIGLITHGYMSINYSLMPNSINLIHFRSFLENSYGQRSNKLVSLSNPPTVRRNARPRLVFIIRTGRVGRVMLNQDEVKRIAEEVGFEVIVYEPKGKTPIRQAYKLMNSSHAMLGVHGAAMTHLLFMRPGAVMMQVLPIGTSWAADVCYGTPAKEMGLQYVEYKIGVEESSLLDKYGKDSEILSGQFGVQKYGWSKMRIYLREQDVKLDLVKFRSYLIKAYEKAERYMENKIVLNDNVS